MPVHRGAVTFARFQVERPEVAQSDVKHWLVRGLKSREFEPIDRRGEEERAAGFVELEQNDATEFSPGALFHGERAVFAWRIDTIRVPAPVMKAELEKWANAFEKEKGRPPSRGEKSENKASIRQILRNRAVPTTKIFDVTWNLSTDQLQLWASSRKVVEEIQSAIEGAFELKLIDRVPAAIAMKLGIPDEALTPTAALVGMEEAEVHHGEA